ncbi:hypothetical protein SAY86_029485 [Trapa natans]|uniref:Uncharacterized protein n=1 Tax=Trapa natans TaxID=22666 RepID=A0AAN7M3R9_TRANT|nr:hypothetical protein SAY86_029485 [Trapa natans]
METAIQPMSREAIAAAEKKLDMALDDIIKMSKRAASKVKRSRASIKNHRDFSNVARGKSSKLGGFMYSRGLLRQGTLARKRSNIQGNHFQLETQAAGKAFAAPFSGKASKNHRGANSNKSRSGPRVGQGATDGGIRIKETLLLQGGEYAIPSWRPKTLDSLFANLKEQRVKAQSRHNSKSVQHNTTISAITRGIPPWSRARFTQ